MTADPRLFPSVLADRASDIACTLEAGDVEPRIAEWREVAALVTTRDPIDGGLRLTFDEIDVQALTDLAIREHECCAFLSFAVGIGSGGTTLEITGPPVAREVIESLADLATSAGGEPHIAARSPS